MATEYINPQWRLPSEKTGNNQGYSMESISATQNVKIPGLANSLNLTDKVSISIWWKTSTSQNNRYIMGFKGPGSANGFDLGMHSSNIGSYAAFATSGSGGLLVNFAYDDGNWHHYVLTYNGTIRKFYIDGVLKAESAASGNMSLDSSGDFYMFATSTGGYGGVGEAVDNCVFDYALSDGGVSVGSTATGQIADLYASTNPMALSSPPAAYYPLGNSAHMGTNYLTPNGALQDYVFSFSGNKTVGLGQNINLGSQSTISYWVKTTGNTGNYVLNNGGNLINTGPYSGNEYYTFKPNNSVNGAGMSNSNINTYILSTNWVHWTVVRNGTGCELYADGQSIATATVANWSGYDTIVSGLGKNAPGIPGDASNFLFWNTNLSATEVETLYNYGSPIQTLTSIPQSSNLKAWYKLDASEIYNSSSTKWEINNQTANYKTALDFSGDGTHNGVQVASDLMNGHTNFT